MENKLTEIWTKIREKANEDPNVQKLKSKWEELDPQNRLYLKAAVAGMVGMVALGLVMGSVWNVRRLKREYAEKSDLLNVLSSANDELRRLRDAAPGVSHGGEQASAPWTTYFESTAATAGLEKSTLTVAPEKAGATTDTAKESIIDLSVKHVSVKQVIRLAYYLENGARPVKLRNLSIDTKADPQGYMDATLTLSAFAMK